MGGAVEEGAGTSLLSSFHTAEDGRAPQDQVKEEGATWLNCPQTTSEAAASNSAHPICAGAMRSLINISLVFRNCVGLAEIPAEPKGAFAARLGDRASLGGAPRK